MFRSDGVIKFTSSKFKLCSDEIERFHLTKIKKIRDETFRSTDKTDFNRKSQWTAGQTAPLCFQGCPQSQQARDQKSHRRVLRRKCSGREHGSGPGQEQDPLYEEGFRARPEAC